MTAEQFAYWLQGFAELNPTMSQPTPEQWKSINDHLKTVFVKVTPPFVVREATERESLQEALRRYREADQRQPGPYPPNISPWIGHPLQITC